MTYTEYCSEYQKLMGELPIKWCFDEAQAEEMFKEFGITRDEAPDKLYSLFGGYYLKSDKPLVDKIFDKALEMRNTLHSLMEEDEEFAVNAFYYEMCNHEYIYDYEGDYNVCDCFGNCTYEYSKDYSDYLREMGYSFDVVRRFAMAKKKYYKEAEENDWF